MQAVENEISEAPSSRGTVAVVLAALLAIAVLFGALGLGGLSLIAGSMKSSDAYRMSLDYLSKAKPVVADLGSPIEDGFMPSGRIATAGDGGSADLSISLEGPKGTGRAHLTLTKSSAGWSIATADWAHGGRLITLVGPSPK